MISLPELLSIVGDMSLTREHSMLNSQSVIDYYHTYYDLDGDDNGFVYDGWYWYDYEDFQSLGTIYDYDSYYWYYQNKYSVSALLTGSYDQDVHVCNIYINYNSNHVKDINDSRDFLSELFGYTNKVIYGNDGPSSYRHLSFSLFDKNMLGDTIGYIKEAVNIVLNVIVVITMLLCSFSLFASMNSNVLEQIVEINITRSVGFSRFAIFRIVFEEALILVFTAIFFGTIVGMMGSLGFTLIVTTILNTPFILSFPWQTVLIMYGIATGIAFIASIFPVYGQLIKPIASFLKEN